MTNAAWVCPVCGRVNAYYVSSCGGRHAGTTISTNNTVISGNDRITELEADLARARKEIETYREALAECRDAAKWERVKRESA